ncbi:MAG: Excinuclease ABC C subunit domain protein [Candidatus Azambacteria bacterium GW2011_GWA1_42_19]|uniref:Excinuclease ABC C subunit domain protein n=1 Tax=Candidatus Azambacteria bacterium GW2011_GWA1_42_19 TaxID=1618609 RepID=A0A0G1BGL5_9BACT|nr:MAG: Excinuclease ABC C subunit domain protein [Candidatus Azambacteria bacterium GW2011_GWA1_42_19]
MKSITKKIPNKPGIYWFSKKGEKIYVGKAGLLKKRIASYFRTKDPRIFEMVGEADNVSFKKAGSVLEAVILEANAIKKYLPKYNIKEKDNRSFVYLVIPKEDFPRPFIARGREVEKYASKNNVFGPYQSYRILKIALNLARKIFPFGMCRPNQGKPCFDYQIGLCPGICVGAISKKDYQKNIKNLTLLFKGEHKRLFKKLKKTDPEAFYALKHVQDVALISNSKIGNWKLKIGNSVQRIEGFDISHLHGSEPVGAMSVFINGEADNSKYRLFKIRNTENKFDDMAMLSEILERRFNHDEWGKPDVVLIDGGRNQITAAKNVLAKRNIFVPVIGIVKILGHSGSAAEGDKLYFQNTKPSVKKILLTSRQVLQQVRNEAHRFAISFQRRKRKI